MRHDLNAYRKLSIGQLSKRVFVYDQSIPDERYFRDQFYALVTGKRGLGDKGTFDDFLWNLVYERTEGWSARYLHFNDYTQRLSVDWAFRAWAEKAVDEITAKWSRSGKCSDINMME